MVLGNKYWKSTFHFKPYKYQATSQSVNTPKFPKYFYLLNIRIFTVIKLSRKSLNKSRWIKISVGKIKKLKKENLIKLVEVRDEWCVSIYLPVNQADIYETRSRLKNLMFEAERELLELGMFPLKVARMLMPIELLLENDEIWKSRQDGFAAFLTPDSFVWFSIHALSQELVVVSNRFHLKPLLTSISSSNNFYLLTLSHNQIKFFDASGTELTEIFLRGMPRSLEHFLMSVELETQNRMLSVVQVSTHFQGKSRVDEIKKIKIGEVFRKVDKVIAEFLKNEERPLVLAGIDYLHPIYHSVNSYQNVIKEGLIGNIDNLSKKQLFEQTLPIIKLFSQAEQAKSVKIYQQLIGSELASDNFSEIFKASNEGRIEWLFVSIKRQIWGKFDQDSGHLQIHQTRQPGDTDLLCVVSTNTLLNGGKIFALLPEEMPNNADIAAILRD